MATLHLHKKIDSETLHLPELSQFVGKTVEITISEQQDRGTDARWDALRDAAGKDLVDPDVASAYREFDREAQRV